MDSDITGILNDWSFKPGRVNVRRVVGKDGLEKIQMRLDLGLLQMVPTGRPDGQRPHGRESLLDYYELKLQQYKSEHDGDDEGFEIDDSACANLRGEGLMYYHRYLAQFVLEDFASVERDTRRNLRMFDFSNRFAKEESDRFALEQYRPYVLMMHARARAYMALAENRSRAALEAAKDGISKIEAFYHRIGHNEAIDHCGQIALLRLLSKDIEAKIPVDPLSKLRVKLASAISEERYEDAASLQEQIHRVDRERPVQGKWPKDQGR